MREPFLKRLAPAAGATLLLLALASAAIYWLAYQDRALPATQKSVIVPPGSGLSGIAALLEREEVIRSAAVFSWYVRAHHLSNGIQAAEYTFAPHQTVAQILATLASAGRAPAVWVVFPEGFTARQIAQRLQERGLVSAAAMMQVVDRTSLIFGTARSSGLEGYLYPDTYLIARQTSARAVAAEMTAQFRRKLPNDYALAAKRLGYTVPQIITIASLIEREAKVDGERALMAGVYYNRLRLRMPLQVDATIEYALPQHKTALSFHDLAADSPYNSYLHQGLPPTPIANPGARSIAAAFHPAKTDFLYYVYKGGGRHQFSRTLADQEAAERRYLH